MQSALLASTEKNQGAAIPDHRAGKYLIFQLANEEFGIQVLKVREIMGMQDITAVPQTPPYIKGVINLRGKVIPVIDFRLKFGLPEEKYTQHTCVIVVEISADSGGPLLMGIVVDGVAEVLTITAADVE
jgi:purine-binding chemotaxis protein CheW